MGSVLKAASIKIEVALLDRKHSIDAFIRELIDLINCFIDSLMTFFSKSRVRTAAAESLPFLLDCAKVRGDSYIFELWNFIFPELLKAIETEPEKDVLSELMTSLSQVLKINSFLKYSFVFVFNL